MQLLAHAGLNHAAFGACRVFHSFTLDPFPGRSHNECGDGRGDFNAASAAPEMKYPTADTLVQVTIGLSILIGLVIVGMLIVQRFRGGIAGKGVSANELITNFQEMHSRGDITDADYRKIKSVLGAKLHSELKDDKETG